MINTRADCIEFEDPLQVFSLIADRFIKLKVTHLHRYKEKTMEIETQVCDPLIYKSQQVEGTNIV